MYVPTCGVRGDVDVDLDLDVDVDVDGTWNMEHGTWNMELEPSRFSRPLSRFLFLAPYMPMPNALVRFFYLKAPPSATRHV